MANYYTDHPEIAFYLQDPLMRRITELKEKGFSESKDYDYAPVDHEDCIENYRRLLEIVGDVAANVIEPNSESVDLEGPHLEDGRMKYASKTLENLEATRKAGLWGLTMPRRYGGLNCPAVVFSMASIWNTKPSPVLTAPMYSSHGSVRAVSVDSRGTST